MGFPHSEILEYGASKQLLQAYRSLARPSSGIDVRAFTVCLNVVFLPSLLCTLSLLIAFYSSQLFPRLCTRACSSNNQYTKKVKVSNLKEVVHPHVLVRIPCYDLSPVNVSTIGPHIT